MQRIILTVIFTSMFVAVQGQNYEIPKWQISMSYFGELLTHPGARIGIATPISQNIKQKKDEAYVTKGWVVGGYFTYYHHVRNHRGLMLTSSIGRHRIGKKGLLLNINLEAGYMLSLLDGEVYEWNGTEMEEASKGSSHIVAGLNGGIGWDFGKKTELPISFLIQPHIYLQAPYNTFFTPRVATEFRLIYHLKK